MEDLEAMQPGSRKQGVFSTALHHLTLFFEQFKSFIKRGNVLELAVGVIIGAAFGKIVSSLVSDIVMPPLGMLLAKLDFRQLKLVLREARGGEPPVTINYGVFLSTILDFLIISVVIFFLVQAVQRLHRKPTAPNPETRECPRCVQVISRRATRCPHCTTEFEESGAEATASLRSGV